MGSAELLASENLINCYLREGGANESERPGVLRIPLTCSHKNLYVNYDRRMLLGDVRLSEPVRLEGCPLHAAELADLLSSEIGRNIELPEGRESDWRQNFLSSLHISDLILAEAPKHGTLDYASSEQSLICGHRFHPSPKSRIGFSDEELREYSPEFAPQIRLHYFAMPEEKNYVSGDPEFIERWRRLTSFFNLNFGEIAFPVHPWQARMALKDDRFAAALASGAIRDLGIAGPQFTITSSVRTLYQPEWDIFIKTSLAVRITNCYRLNLPNEMKAVRIVNSLLESVKSLAGSHVRVLREPMGLDFNSETGVKLGSLFREGLGRDRGALLCAALFGDRHFGVARVSELGVDAKNISDFFARYCQRLVPPVIDLFWQEGLMLEPHLQNVLVVIENGLPERFVIRDLDNARVINPAVNVLPDMVSSLTQAWRRFTYCLIVNHLAEVAGTLSELCPPNQQSAEEERLWKTLRKCLADCVIPEPFKAELLNGPSLFSKKNFFTRVTRGNDGEAPFAEIRNPLAL